MKVSVIVFFILFFIIYFIYQYSHTTEIRVPQNNNVFSLNYDSDVRRVTTRLQINNHSFETLNVPVLQDMKNDSGMSFISIGVLAYGRLGNKMYGYALALALSKRFNMTLSLPPNVIAALETIFEGIQAIPDPKGHWEMLPYEDIASFDTIPSNMYLRIDGYPVNVNYFDSIRDEIVFQHFRFRSKYIVVAQDTLHEAKQNKLLQGQSNFMYVGLHIRKVYVDMRTKYMTRNGKLPETDYLLKAMKFLEDTPGKNKTVIYLVVTDDKKWVEENILSLPNVIWGGTNRNDPGYDMALMAQCNHTILTVGTFGFWAAYMGRRGYVIMPADYNSLSSDDQDVNIRESNLINNKWIFL